ncbi:MAG: DUF2283 domain-containing protein [bacterium]|nr:DUF2283 domain-containing protein [bacterium]
MSNPRMQYFEADDIIHINIQDGTEENSVELSPNITVELNAKGEIIGIEILHASSYIRDNVLDTVQGKLLQQGT